MIPTRIAGLAIAVGGGVVLALGLSAADAPVNEVMHGLTGQYSDRTVVQIVCGAAALVVGTLLALKGQR